jgi:glycosyltransferase involved in cell wall biosynthesis
VKVLHLFSNIKRTGPAEPAINLAAKLKQAGWQIHFACCSYPSHKRPAAYQCAQQRGIEPLTGFYLTKHLNIRRNWQDKARLARFLNSEDIDIVHTHLNNDHLIGGLAARGAQRPVKVVRTCYDGDGFPRSFREHYLLRKLSDGLIVCSNQMKESITSRTNFPADYIWVIPGAVDLERFHPGKELPDMRPQFGLSPSDFVVGIVARMQPHRRFNVLLDAMKIISQKNANVKLLIIGRGSKMQKVVVEPVQRMGLEQCVVFGGYHVEEQYVAALSCFDAKIFLVPGSDGTCRAVREAMAMGKPIIAARRGMLPEIVDHGMNGLIIEDTPGNIAEAVLYLADNGEATVEMGERAAQKARRVFRLEHQAERVAQIYEELDMKHLWTSVEKNQKAAIHRQYEV